MRIVLCVRRRSRRSVVVRAVALLLVLATACADRDDSSAVSRSDDSPPKVLAFLRAVQSSQPENQAAFLDELARAGYVEGDTLELIAKDLSEVHPSAAQAEAAVGQWVTQGVDLIVALSTASAQTATKTAPDTDVLFLVNDAVSSGLVSDVRRPSGRATGVTFAVPADRTLDVIRRAFTDAVVVGIVYPPDDPAAAAVVDAARKGSDALGMELVAATFAGIDDAAAAVESVRAQAAEVLWVLNTPTTIRHIDALTAAASSAALPLVSNTVVPTAVATLQPDTVELYRQIARQAVRIFEGDKISDIPVENPARFVLEVNLRQASAVGTKVSDALVDSADRVVR